MNKSTPPEFSRPLDYSLHFNDWDGDFYSEYWFWFSKVDYNKETAQPLTLNPRFCLSVRFMNSESGISGEISFRSSRFLFSRTNMHLSKKVRHKADAKQAIIVILAGV